MPAKRHQRSITTGRALRALTLGALVGVLLHILNPNLFSWWFVAGVMIGFLFAFGAYLRRDRWEERNTALVLAAIFVTVPLVGSSIPFAVGSLAILAGYYVVLVRSARKHRRGREIPPSC